MRRFRFSMTTFLIVITLLAGGLAALVSQSRWGASAAYSVFLALLCLSIAGAILARDESRAFWIGFAVFGWGYWFFEYRESPNTQYPYYGGVYLGYYPSRPQQPPPGLITTELLGKLEESLDSNRKVGAQVVAQWQGGGYYAGTIQQADGSGNYLVAWADGSAPSWTSSVMPGAPQMRVTGHAVMGSLWALLGGALATAFFGGWLAAKRTSEGRAPSTTEEKQA
jgi:hypothetical protein